MVRKKLDNRIRVLIENGVALGHRSFFVVVGDKGRDQVVILHHILSKAAVKARPSVLWCYKKELGFSSHRKKRMRQLKKKVQSGRDINEDDPFDMFVSSTQIRYCYYSETHKILGNTFGMVVLQDFEALTPNLLARTIETVEGGGLVVILLRSLSSLRQLYTMTMDVHARYRTEAHQDVVGRFNERFILSLASCKKCMVIDDQLNILPISSHIANLEAVPPRTKDEPLESELELKNLVESLQDTQPIGVLIGACKTLDQAKCVLKFLDVITEKSLKSTISLTAARGRGKSAALGLSMAGAIAFGYSNIFVTSPSPENLKTLFEFILKGFDCLEYQEHIDYELIQSSNPEFNKAVIRVNVFRDHRQTIQYVHPSDAAKLGQAELLVIDEAAAIPLPLVKELLGPYLVFMASTINGYEGTGRSLSLKLLQQLREQTASVSGTKTTTSSSNKKDKELVSATGRTLNEIVLEESIRYRQGDDVEAWLNNLLCLDATSVKKLTSGCPPPTDCELYLVNRDTLFCFHKASETFLQRLMSIYVAAHYKNTPNDLQMISDAPAHQLYCLLGPVDPNQSNLPEILCVVQVCLEGEISKSSVVQSLSQGKRASGDLIPWTVAQQFQDNDFPSLSGARVVRIATHPDYQGMGYGSRAVQLLSKYFQGKMANTSETNDENGYRFDEDSSKLISTNEENVSLLEEQIGPRKNLPPLLSKLDEIKAPKLNWIGVSYGLTNNLLRFWKRNGFVPVYLRQTPNDLTGEFSCIQLKILNKADDSADKNNWLSEYYKDFRRRFLNLLSYQFNTFHSSLALSILQQKSADEAASDLSREELSYHLTNYDLKRLELYGQNLVDHHLITDLLPVVSRLYFLKKINVNLTAVQSAILLSGGLQHKIMDQISKELDVVSSQLMGLFNRSIRKIVQKLNSICEAEIESKIGLERRVDMQATKVSLDDDLREGEKEATKKLEKDKRRLMLDDVDDDELEKFAIRGNEDDWSEALKDGGSGLLSVKRSDKDKKKRKLTDLDYSRSSNSSSTKGKTGKKKFKR